jgi:hypothetical protein
MLLILHIIYNLIFMNGTYTHYYANSRHDGFLDRITISKGLADWEYILPDNPDKRVEARLILVYKDKLIVDAMTEIHCLDSNGSLQWKREKWYGSQIVINDDLIFYTSAERKDRMEAVDINNRVVISDYVIHEIIDVSDLKLFEPSKDGLIAQVQYTGLQEVSSEQFVIYKSGYKGPGYSWSVNYYEDISPVIPLVNHEEGYLISSTGKDIILFDINTKERETKPFTKIPIPSENLFISSSKDGLIYLGYSLDNKAFLQCLDKNGKEIFKATFTEEFTGLNKVVAPPVLADSITYLLTSQKIICIVNGKVSWIKQSDLPFTYATALGDNSLLAVQGNKLLHISPGNNVLFSVNTEGSISAPPVVSEAGKVILTTGKVIYSFN